MHFNIAHNEIRDLGPEDLVGWGSELETLILSSNHITSLGADLFEGAPKLRELSLSFNPLVHISNDAFAGLEDLMSLELSFAVSVEEFPNQVFRPLEGLRRLSFDNNGVRSISSGYLFGSKFLNLAFNEIEVLPRKLFKSGSLAEIRLNNNRITTIHSHTFEHLNHLESILLSSNKITTIRALAFKNLPNLAHLILSNNLIQTISEHAFSHLPVILKVDLHDNLLGELNLNSFANVSHITNLNVSGNRISSCKSDVHILNVNVLDLQRNRFIHVPHCLHRIRSVRKLYLSSNNITSIPQNSFMHLNHLEELYLSKNGLSAIHKHSFAPLCNLQVLDMSCNRITALHSHQLATLVKLRILNLSHNNLKYTSKELFRTTRLEMLDLSHNAFTVVPSPTLAEVGPTLRYLIMSHNGLDHVDSTTFPDIPHLQHLRLDWNKLTILPDNVFTSLGLLQKLDISRNPLRANFKELFHYAQSLKELSLANTGISTIPSLPLPNLVSLNASYNQIEHVYSHAVQALTKLKYLYLDNNQLLKVPAHLWTHLPDLKALDLSHNPIKVSHKHLRLLTY